MSLRTSQLLLIALLGGGLGAWYGVRTAARGDAALLQRTQTAERSGADAYFCFAPPDRAYAKLAARLGELETRGRERETDTETDASVIQQARVQLAMLNERLGRAGPANAQWARALEGCSGEACKRETWREQAQKACKP
ncbi:MAG: hypothetical protein KC766_36440 [Myxococcales bacterium]|nr:hypothetical protein [Myxococcales bacterium]